VTIRVQNKSQLNRIRVSDYGRICVERGVEAIYNTQIHAIIDFISNAVLSDCFFYTACRASPTAKLPKWANNIRTFPHPNRRESALQSRDYSVASRLWKPQVFSSKEAIGLNWIGYLLEYGTAYNTEMHVPRVKVMMGSGAMFVFAIIYGWVIFPKILKLMISKVRIEMLSLGSI